jgi:phosphatidylserine/phosphatidylglycerophosphate/cardiolipin synthase-like enzyme
MPATYSVITDPVTALQNYLDIIAGATRCITIATWIISESDVTTMILSAIVAAIKRGLRVTIAYYGGPVPEIADLFHRLVAVTGGQQVDMSILKGATLLEFGTLETGLYGMHEKILVADRKTCIFSDRNLDGGYYGANVLFTGMDIVVRDHDFAVLADRHICSCLQRVVDSSILPVTVECPHIQLFVSSPVLNTDHITPIYIQALQNAQREVLIVNVLFDPVPSVLQALHDACNRGVSVTIVTNYWDNVTAKVRASLTRTLAAAKVHGWGGSLKLLGYTGPATLHNKFLVTDACTFCSSYNHDWYSAVRDCEYMVRFLDASVRQSILDYAQQLLQDSQPIKASWLARQVAKVLVGACPCVL